MPQAAESTSAASEAVRWYLKAAEAGNVRAQYNLALMYHLGEGITRGLRRRH